MLRGVRCPEASLPSRVRDPSVAESAPQGDMVVVCAFPLLTLNSKAVNIRTLWKGDFAADHIKFHSGNAAASKPLLIIVLDITQLVEGMLNWRHEPTEM